MAVGKILRKPKIQTLEVTGQEIVSGEYQETIGKFQTVALTNTGIIKANNLLNISNAQKLGYALENGTEGQTKTMMSLFEVEE